MSGGAFLHSGSAGDDILTPETLTEEHHAIGRMVDEFWAQEVEPSLPALWAHQPGTGRRLLQRAAALGLTAMQIPEAFGGLDLSLSRVIMAVEHLCDDPSYSGWHLGHSGIGTLPLVYYGTAAQQAKYLPRLATAELIAAYALTEPGAGSDALAVRTRADLAPDGRHYVLNGQKMWITNGGEADLFTVFAKVNGTAFTAFLVERGFGVRSGAEEHKMGLVGTSTTALFFDDVRVPLENVLGDVGQGHRIAFNVLNAGRLKMGPLALRGARKILAASRTYARERHAFGRPIAELGAIRQMLADADIRLFAVESATWRVVGLIEADTVRRQALGHSVQEAELAAFEEYAGECSIVKVAASEMLDAVADTGVQVHGGYGYHRDSFVERAYRDARINRIFEGTNEVNRVALPGLLMKRTARAGAPIADLAHARLQQIEAARDEMPATTDEEIVARGRTLALLMLGAAQAHHGDDLRGEQEITLRIADAMIETFLMDSCMVRTHQLVQAGHADAARAQAMTAVYLRDALPRITSAAVEVFAALRTGTDLADVVAAVRRIGAFIPVDTIALRRLL